MEVYVYTGLLNSNIHNADIKRGEVWQSYAAASEYQ